ncbi:MAG: calcium/sodium antiporter [Rikenellaceae bacterium]
MILDFILLIVGLVLIVVGADCMTDGAALVARRFKVSEFIIGLTIIAIGTSAPEMVVSFSSALSGNTEMALGNVLGSNMFNTFVIVGVVATIRPIRLSRENCFKTIPATLCATFLLLLFCLNLFGFKFMPESITRLEGAILLSGFLFFMIQSVSSTGKTIESYITSNQTAKKESLAKGFVMAIGGIAVLLFGGDIFLDKAVAIAKALGVSNYIISVTLLAGGTSLPELVASVMAAKKGMPQMALGNVLGSNVANILLVLGGASLISPISLASVSFVDVSLVCLGSLLLFMFIFTFRRHQIDRIEGVMLLLIYVVYIISLIVR